MQGNEGLNSIRVKCKQHEAEVHRGTGSHQRPISCVHFSLLDSELMQRGTGEQVKRRVQTASSSGSGPRDPVPICAAWGYVCRTTVQATWARGSLCECNSLHVPQGPGAE